MINTQVIGSGKTRGDGAGQRPLVSTRAQVERGDSQHGVDGCSRFQN